LAGDAEEAAGGGRARPLEGLTVLELSIAVAAPTCGRYLAHHGANVFRVESPRYPDVARLFGSAWARGRDDIELTGAWLDTGPYVSEMSAGKRSIGLDLKHPAGVEAARRLLANCDVMIMNFSAPAVTDMGMGYEDVRAVRPDIIYVAMPGFGTDPDSPYYHYLSWGPNQAPLVGLDAMTGYPDQEPAGVAAFAPPDFMAGLHAFVAILAALEHRDRTGEGTFVELSQFEATVALLGPFLLDYELSGRVVERDGNRLPGIAPQGVYPCLGADRWLAISITDDDAWRALGRVAGNPAWASDTRFNDMAGRAAHHDELDRLIGEWTAVHRADELTVSLTAAGVAASAVLDNTDLLGDPQVRSREYYDVKPNTRFGRDLFSGNPQRLLDTPGRTDTAGPEMCEHTIEVLCELGGYEAHEVEKLIEEGVAFGPAQPEVVLTRPYDAYLDILFPTRERRR
jgi:benzylsuccinate CoA-transferase BbsF subunit